MPQSTTSLITSKLGMIILKLGMIVVFLGIIGCAGVQRPDADICGVNAKSSKLRCYNIKNDFNDDGTRKPDAQPVNKKISSLNDLNGGIYVSPADFEKFKVWLGDSRDWISNHCQ